MKPEKNIYSDVRTSTRKFLCTLQLQIVITNIDCNERPFAIIEENNESYYNNENSFTIIVARRIVMKYIHIFS